MASFTLADLQGYVGAPAIEGAVYYTLAGEHAVTSWEDVFNAERGWWWALTRHCGDHAIVVALGFAPGDRRDRDVDIARALLRHETPVRAVA